MKINTTVPLFCVLFLISGCADYKSKKNTQVDLKQYYSSSGFALVYNENLYEKKIVNKKLNNEDLLVMHSSLKRNTPVKIINPDNSKIIETKIYKKAIYPNIFNVVISEKVATKLGLDLDNPFIEIIELKKNKTFIAKEGSIFEEEKNVADKAPVDEIKMNDLTVDKIENKKKVTKKSNFILVISDFYYIDSANDLMKELIKKINIKNISVKKINNNKYRLLVGPFENFNALKDTYISLNKLGFDDLNIYKE